MRTKTLLQNDLSKIKAILAKTAFDAKNEAANVVNDSFDDIKERTVTVKDNIRYYTKKKPFISLGLSLLTGLMISRVLHK